MKKEIIKGVVKYIALFILIAYFVLNVSMQITNYAYAKFIFADAEQAGTKEELIVKLKELEEYANNLMKSYEGTDIPALGAALATFSYTSDYFEPQMIWFSVVIGTISGILVYILKNVECKKIVHYIIIYLLLLIVLTLLVMIGAELINSIYRTKVISGLEDMSLGGFLENTIVVGIPYTIVYAIVCLIIYVVNKNKAKKLNSEI